MFGSINKAEERRVLWTTYNNLKMWFHNWGEDLVKLGFAYKDAKGGVIIPKEQLRRILNINETCLSLDGSDNVRGGRPTTYFYDPRLPVFGLSTSKCSLTLTDNRKHC